MEGPTAGGSSSTFLLAPDADGVVEGDVGKNAVVDDSQQLAYQKMYMGDGPSSQATVGSFLPGLGEISRSFYLKFYVPFFLNFPNFVSSFHFERSTMFRLLLLPFS